MNNEPLTKDKITHEWDLNQQHIYVDDVLSALEGLKNDVAKVYTAESVKPLIDKWFPILLSQPSSRSPVQEVLSNRNNCKQRGVKAGEFSGLVVSKSDVKYTSRKGKRKR